MRTKQKKKINSQNKVFYNIDEESIDLKDISNELFNINESNREKIPIPKEPLSLKECLKKLNQLSKKKIYKKYNCTQTKYEHFLVEYLLNNVDCHLVSIFKEKMLTDYIDEFLRREYNFSESKERIPKFSIYYKNYLQFFCKPTYNNFIFNDLIQNYGEKKAELYYKDHYQGGLSNDDEDNGFEESSSDESSNKENEYEFNNNGEIFNKVIKEKLDNVTVMTTINTTGNNTINLNVNNEKIEVFSENKAEVSNDTTINDLMEDIKLETKRLKNKKRETLKNKFKNSYKKFMNESLKTQENYKFQKNLSIESKKKLTAKDFSKKNILYKEKKDKEKDKLINNDKIASQKIKSQIFKYNVESHKINKNNINKLSQNKIQKIFKKTYTKNTYSNIYNNTNLNYNYNNKESYTNIRNSSNVKSPEHKLFKKNSISGLSTKKLSYRSRNNVGSLYKNVTTVGNNIPTNNNINNNFQTTQLNKKSLSNLGLFGTNTFKTMNFMQTAHHQRTNSQLIKKQNIANKKKLQVPNICQDKKTSSLKMLMTDTGNHAYTKPTIKIKKNNKLKSKHANVNMNNLNNLNNVNNKKILINNNENNLNNKITVTTTNYYNNMNNRYSKNNKKVFGDSNDSISINNPNYSNFINQMSTNHLLCNNEDSENINKNPINNNFQTKSNSNLMQIALSLLFESNSPNKHGNLNSKNSITSNNNTSLNNNPIVKNAIMNQKNNNKNTYNSNDNINASTHYNININNQINININNKANGKNVNNKGSKIKNKNNKLNINVGNHSKKILSKRNTTTNNNLNNKLAGISNLNNNKIKIRTRNYNIPLKNGLTQNSNFSGKYENISKGYHTKSLSNLTELINHNKKLISIYKSMSKSKSKEKK